jgi:F0F1-type ATP synthase epsilon subunit
MAQAASKLLEVKLRSPYQNYYSGAATSVSAKNRLGVFDVLPDHTPFFTLLVASVVTVRTAKETLEFKVENGILKTKNNQVDIFLNI